MDKIEDYRAKILNFLNEYVTHKPAYRDIEIEKIFDTQQSPLVISKTLTVLHGLKKLER